jgi:hypothetical protein
MRRFILGITVLSVFFILFSCSNSGNDNSKISSSSDDKITQKEDGTINLDLKKASRYNDDTNPSCNTAEWNIVISKAGRFKVWLSSATLDTMDLQYNNTVKISLQDERLDVRPVGDKIVLNARDVQYPYYRADSYMGTFYVQEPGEYSVQIISEKVIAQSENNNSSAVADHTKLMSVILTPMTR